MALRHQDQGRANLHRIKETFTLRVMPESYIPPYILCPSYPPPRPRASPVHTSAVGQKELLVQAVSIDDKETLVTSLTGPAWAHDPTCSTADQTGPLDPQEAGLLHHGPLGNTSTGRLAPKHNLDGQM